MKNSRLTLVLRLAACIVTLAVGAQAQTFSYLANFDGENGTGPEGAVVQATDGNFYGTTDLGGASQWGVLYKVTPSGDLSVVYNFCSQPNCADGSLLSSSPILGSDGNLYGTTSGGGSDAGFPNGSGTIYKMTLAGEITTLYTFCVTTPCNDGQGPGGLTLAGDGNFYGTATVGGKFNEGTIFRVSPTGAFKVLHSFCSLKNCKDGERPFYPPIQGIDGNFYGTASGGGANGGGVVYKLTPAGVYTVIHNFCSDPNCTDGSVPTTIVQDAKGDFFGTTELGSNGTFYGTVFKIKSTNLFSVLKSFDQEFGFVVTGLVLANDGNLYGVTEGPEQGFDSNGGTIFEISPAGKLSFPHIFASGCSGGYDPWGPLSQNTNGILYGTTLYGNSNGGCDDPGTIYSLSNGLSALVETVPVAGSAGKTVLILGNGLTGTTSVTFNGVQADFTVESDTYIKATVPTDATTGAVSVVTPSGTLNSNPQFVVTR